MRALELQSSGMEFASEMVVRATLAGYNVVEVPTTLAPDGRSRPPHLRSWRDGWRHLRFLLLYSPRWLFLVPGLALMVFGLGVGTAVAITPITVGGVTFDVNTLVAASVATIIGFQAVQFAVFTKVYATQEGFLPPDERLRRGLELFTLERGLAVGVLLVLLGLAGLVASLSQWQGVGFGDLDPRSALRLVVPSATAMVLGCQTVLASLFLSILRIRRSPRRAGRVRDPEPQPVRCDHGLASARPSGHPTPGTRQRELFGERARLTPEPRRPSKGSGTSWPGGRRSPLACPGSVPACAW